MLKGDGRGSGFLGWRAWVLSVGYGGGFKILFIFGLGRRAWGWAGGGGGGGGGVYK